MSPRETELKGSRADMATKTGKTANTQEKTQTAPAYTREKTQTAPETRKPSEQALQAVDVAVGAVPTVADAVSNTAETWRKAETRSREVDILQKRVQNLRDRRGRSAEIEALRKRLGSELEKAETKGGDVRRQVTEQLVGQARRARDRVEPVYRERFEPIVKERVEPVYRERLEPTVKRVRERI
jgi:DNA repair exonuclease SbcCD ATPase subunit